MMKALLYENTIALKDMKVGQIARSEDESKVFACGYFWNKEKGGNDICIMDLCKMNDQYLDSRIEEQRVVILKSTEKIMLTL
jgi:hypothetical protein